MIDNPHSDLPWRWELEPLHLPDVGEMARASAARSWLAWSGQSRGPAGLLHSEGPGRPRVDGQGVAMKSSRIREGAARWHGLRAVGSAPGRAGGACRVHLGWRAE